MARAQERSDELVALIDSLPDHRVQNALMRVSDRELAIALMRTKPVDRARVLKRIAHAKATRVNDESRYLRRLNVTDPQFLKMIDAVIDRLVTGRAAQIRSYIRPRAARRTGR